MGGNLMIRMIDIVFILLFGFVAVSQISSVKYIDPPKSTEASVATPEGTRILTIGVEKDGHFAIDGGEMVFTKLPELKRFLSDTLKGTKAAGEQLGVRIRAHWESPVEYSVGVARICRNLGVPKGLDVMKN